MLNVTLYNVLIQRYCSRLSGRIWLQTIGCNAIAAPNCCSPIRQSEANSSFNRSWRRILLQCCAFTFTYRHSSLVLHRTRSALRLGSSCSGRYSDILGRRVESAVDPTIAAMTCNRVANPACQQELEVDSSGNVYYILLWPLQMRHKAAIPTLAYNNSGLFRRRYQKSKAGVPYC